MSFIMNATTLPYIFATLMGVAILVYTILDGYDLGVGMLLDNASWYDKDKMIASIGPFWDANETWLILGVGILLVAFPAAHGVILTALYFPVALMLLGLIFRGIAFDFRAKVPYQQKWRWNSKFFYGSLLTSLSQGYMLGAYITGFSSNLSARMFALLTAVALSSAYCLVGATWLIMKCEGRLQKKAIQWARYYLINSSIGLIAVSLVTPLVSERIFAKWFSFPKILLLLPIPLITTSLIVWLYTILTKMPFNKDRYCWLPFILTVKIYILSFIGLAYSFFPYIVPNKMTVIEAAAADESLAIILLGVVVVLPVLLAYTALTYRVFGGKATELRYD